MGRIRALVLVLALLAVAGVLFGEYEVRGKDVFPVSRSIAKIYAHRLGYKIVFQKDNSDFGVFYGVSTYGLLASYSAWRVW